MHAGAFLASATPAEENTQTPKVAFTRHLHPSKPKNHFSRTFCMTCTAFGTLGAVAAMATWLTRQTRKSARS